MFKNWYSFLINEYGLKELNIRCPDCKEDN